MVEVKVALKKRIERDDTSHGIDVRHMSAGDECQNYPLVGFSLVVCNCFVKHE